MRALWLLLALGVIGGLFYLAGRNHEARLAEHDPRRQSGEREIVMLYAEWCGYCRRQRAEFARAGVRYRALDVDTAEGGQAMQALKARGVPVTVIGQEVVHGYNTVRLQQLLTPLGYQVY